MTPPEPKPTLIRLDWRQYFRAFSEDHGGNPVVVGGRQVFEDGWQYSSTSYRGPEWPPPTDRFRLKWLMTEYWTKRKQIVTDELWSLKEQVKGLEQAMKERNGRLFFRVKRQTGLEPGSPHIMRNSQPLTEQQIESWKSRIEWLEKDASICDERLKEIADGVLERYERDARHEGSVDLRVGQDGSDPWLASSERPDPDDEYDNE